jgi:hypothetical protein
MSSGTRSQDVEKGNAEKLADLENALAAMKQDFETRAQLRDQELEREKEVLQREHQAREQERQAREEALLKELEQQRHVREKELDQQRQAIEQQLEEHRIAHEEQLKQLRKAHEQERGNDRVRWETDTNLDRDTITADSTITKVVRDAPKLKCEDEFPEWKTETEAYYVTCNLKDVFDGSIEYDSIPEIIRNAAQRCMKAALKPVKNKAQDTVLYPFNINHSMLNSKNPRELMERMTEIHQSRAPAYVVSMVNEVHQLVNEPMIKGREFDQLRQRWNEMTDIVYRTRAIYELAFPYPHLVQYTRTLFNKYTYSINSTPVTVRIADVDNKFMTSMAKLGDREGHEQLPDLLIDYGQSLIEAATVRAGEDSKKSLAKTDKNPNGKGNKPGQKGGDANKNKDAQARHTITDSNGWRHTVTDSNGCTHCGKLGKHRNAECEGSCHQCDAKHPGKTCTAKADVKKGGLKKTFALAVTSGSDSDEE